ncbi:asparaginase domain-containing protein [Bradyrhizobium sp. DOA1]|uniref:asparaginase domain-containing protein n=1 Tax=Bradyrhizobium sp. DOA1 TaxID=1126616 RepID=UPI000A50E867|nr:asparaginase domain-containing protein [Bradyrhizobium sp. DOA1]
MISDAVTSASHQPGRISRLAIPLMAVVLCFGCIGAAVQAAEPAANLPRILVLATGGTIAGQADPRATGAYKSGQITGEQLMQSVPGLDKLAKLNAEQISSIGSQT